MNSKRFNSNLYNGSKEGGQPKAGTRVPGGKPPQRYYAHQKNYTAAKVQSDGNREDVAEKEKVFKRNHPEKTIKRELFILEGEEKFDKMSLRSKMTAVAKKGDSEFQDWFYTMGTEGNLPKGWDEFKNEVVRYCTGTSLSTQRKFKEERWYQFLERIKDWAMMKEYSEKEVLQFLKTIKAPPSIRTLIYTSSENIATLIKQVRDWETWSPNEEFTVGIPKGGKAKVNVNERKCWICEDTGHVKRDCPQYRKYENNNINNINNPNKGKTSGIMMRYVFIGGKKCNVIFDSGSDISLLSMDMVKYLPEAKIQKLEVPEEYELINDNKIYIYKKVTYDVQYNKNIIPITFGVFENNKFKKVIISNKDIKRLEAENKVAIVCNIKTEGNEVVSWHRPIKSIRDKEDFVKLCNEYEKRGIIEPSESLWCNPVVLLRKKSGDLRFCLDFRRLNDLVKLDEFEIPKISELLSKLNGMRYFTSIDLKDGFFQVPIANEDREKTTFSTGTRLMRFTKMPQGYKNSPAIFQRYMTIIMGDLIDQKCLIYIDDILVYGRTESEHEQNFKQVMERLNQYNLKENEDKRCYKKEEIEFLGFLISLNKIRPKISRSQGIINYQKPKNKKSLQRFIGLLNYDRSFIENLSIHLKPFYELLYQEKIFNWTEEHSKLFEEIKNKWSQKLELYIPDRTGEFTLETDVSQTGIGAVLRQNKQPIAYISRTLTGAEKNYGITDREILGGLWAMEKFIYYLDGRHFKYITDHKAVLELKSKVEFGSQRLVRWFERLERFNFTVTHRPGKEMVVTDALSRSLNIIELKDGKEDEHKIMKIHEKFNHRKTIQKELADIGIIISKDKLNKILGNCKICAVKDKKLENITGFVKTYRPGEKVGVDILEVLRGVKIVVAIDYFSRFVYAKEVSSKHAEKIVEFLSEISRDLKIEKIVADNGREFANEKVKNWSKQNKVEIEYAIPYFHESNGRVERVNRTLRNAIKKSKGSLKTKLKKIVDNYNLSYHRGIKMRPVDALKLENRNTVLKNQEDYGKEFYKKRRNKEILNKGDKVYIRKEIKSNKMDNEFEQIGEIKDLIRKDIYEVKIKDGSSIKRHISQLKKLKEGNVDTCEQYQLKSKGDEISDVTSFNQEC